MGSSGKSMKVPTLCFRLGKLALSCRSVRSTRPWTSLPSRKTTSKQSGGMRKTQAWFETSLRVGSRRAAQQGGGHRLVADLLKEAFPGGRIGRDVVVAFEVVEEGGGAGIALGCRLR